MLRVIDLFSGIGGFSYAAERLVGGFETVQFVEKEPYCQKVLVNHWPHVPIHPDICTYKPSAGQADVVVGGFPCQDISLAGQQVGIKIGTRSGLFYEFVRIICLVRPRFVVMENVAAILGNGLDTVLAELAQVGYDAEWSCIRASDVGACHRRDRWWLVAYPNSAKHSPEGAKQSTAGIEQYRELGVAHPSGSGLQGEKFPWGSPARSLCPNWGGYISEPVIRRGDDGLSGRVDRVRALGNAVVPQVAAIPLARIKQLAGSNG